MYMTQDCVVEVGNGDKMKDRGICNYLEVEMQGIPIGCNIFSSWS